MRNLFIFLLFLTATATFAGGKKDKTPPPEPAPESEETDPDTVFVTTFDVKHNYLQKEITGEVLPFGEVWGWVMQGRESELAKNAKVTDVGYFAAEISTYGKLVGVPKRRVMRNFPGKVHLVLVCDSRSLAHFVLDPAFGLRDTLLDDIIAASADYDGVQVDYELIPGKDVKNFLAFLTELSNRVHQKKKLFSVCVPARTRTLKDDAFPYAQISEISDRVMIMAYDEHWSTSKPGPIASVGWCRNVAKYCVSVIPPEKLVMGLPFYGRTWSSEKVAQGWYYSGINRIIKQYDSDNVRYVNDIPTTNVRMNVNVTCYFEDAYSTYQKLKLYNEMGVHSVAFWRIGQEDPGVWNWMTIGKTAVAQKDNPLDIANSKTIANDKVDTSDQKKSATSTVPAKSSPKKQPKKDDGTIVVDSSLLKKR